VTWLTPDGLAAALGIGAAVWWGLGWRGAALLVAFFISGSLLTQLATGRRGGARRTARQVLANGGVAAVGALFGSWPAAAGALAAAAADTWATEIGSFSPFPPRLITTWARVTKGTSGGITALGTAGGVAGAFAMAALGHLLPPHGAGRSPVVGVALLAAAGVAGMLTDSGLGATAQGLYECGACAARSERADTVCHEPVRLIRGWRWLDNDAVNLAATLVGAALSLLGAWVSS
jgi:uncharacterized protein (TIGR00297 family)